MDSTTCCTHSLALTKRKAGGTEVLQRNLSAYHFSCHWTAWSLKGRYSLFENKAKREEDTGRKKFICSTAHKRTRAQGQPCATPVLFGYMC